MDSLTLTDDLADFFRQFSEVTTLVRFDGAEVGLFQPAAVYAAEMCEKLVGIIDADEMKRRLEVAGTQGESIRVLFRRFQAVEVLGREMLRDPQHSSTQPQSFDPAVYQIPMLLFTVEDVFELKDRGLAVFVVAPSPEQPIAAKGMTVELRRSDGKVFSVSVLAVEPTFCQNHDRCALLPLKLGKEDVPQGSEVWVVN